MSKLVKETEDYLIIERYIHDDPDSFSPWELDDMGNPKYSAAVHEAENYAAYELKIEYRIDKNTGEVIYLKFDGIPLPN